MRAFADNDCIFFIKNKKFCKHCPFVNNCSKKSQPMFTSKIVSKIIAIKLLILSVFACKQKEIPINKFNRGETMVQVIELGSKYENQVYFSFTSDNMVQHPKKEWDLELIKSNNSYYILLNTSKAMRASTLTNKEYTTIKDTLGSSSLALSDASSGNLDSTAIKKLEASMVLVINNGYDENGKHQGFYKLKIDSIHSDYINITYSNIYKPQEYKLKWQYNSSICNRFSFIANSMVTNHPLNFDLCFTQYTTYFSDPPMFYLVTGVLSQNCEIWKIKNGNYSAISASDTINTIKTKHKDAIGYDWKTYDFATNIFTVNPNDTYIIKTSLGFLYKLHFIDFYNSDGLKGYPKFEYQMI